jgi:hypothetical protein
MITRHSSSISRRRVLAGLGAIGVASVGAGLGTTAYFRDEESVAAELEAGRVGLLLDYRATYSPWDPILDGVYPRSPDVDTADLDRDPETTDDVVEGPIYVTGQAPDIRDDEGNVVDGQRWGDVILNLDACEDIELQIAEAEGPGAVLDAISLGPADFPNYAESYVDGAEGTMFVLDDVNPKDRGEAIMSVHMCDNPGYLWVRPDVTLNDENGAVEPETTVGDVADVASDDMNGELLDHLWVSAWYDANCNNLKDTTRGGGAPVSVELVLDASGSMAGSAGPGQMKNEATIDAANFLADQVLAANSANRVGVTFFGESGSNGPARVVQSLTDDSTAVDAAIDSLPAENRTPLGAGVSTGQSGLAANNPSGNDPIMIVLSDGVGTGGPSQAQDAKDAGTRVITIAFGADVDTSTLETMASAPSDAFIPASDTLQTIFEAISEEIIGGEVCLYEGSLGGLTDFVDRICGVPLEGDPENRENCIINAAECVSCFDPGVHCFTFEWYLPCYMEQPDGEGFNQLPSCYGDLSFRASQNAGADEKTLYDELVERGVVTDGDDIDVNVAQTDRLEFAVEYATIQCRHNMTNANPFGGDDSSSSSNGQSQPV